MTNQNLRVDNKNTHNILLHIIILVSCVVYIVRENVKHYIIYHTI